MFLPIRTPFYKRSRKRVGADLAKVVPDVSRYEKNDA